MSQDLHALVDQGIDYEDVFIEQYMKLMLDEEFLALFGSNKEEARVILIVLIEDSKGHRAGLVKLKENLH